MILLIDADYTAYSAAAGALEDWEMESDYWAHWCDHKKAKESIQRKIDSYITITKITDFKLCFSDKENFRKTLNPQYKAKRPPKPVGYGSLKDWAMDKYPSISKPGLEADDVMGILSTKHPGKTVNVSVDKDIDTIPGKFLHLHPDGTTTWYEVSQQKADEAFLMQALMGDRVDGYEGVPGVGPKTAEKLLKKHGYVWKTVEDAYLKAGLTKEDALMNARMARILRVEDYDFEKEQVKLWNP